MQQQYQKHVSIILFTCEGFKVIFRNALFVLEHFTFKLYNILKIKVECILLLFFSI